MSTKITTAVILAGGLGQRLHPFTLAIPKPLMPVGEVSLLERQIFSLKKVGIDNIVIATNYKSSYLERFIGDGSHLGVSITISKEEEPLGTAAPLRLIQNLPDDFLVMNGDILTLENLSLITDCHLLNQKLLTVCIKEQVTPFNFGHVQTLDSNIVSIAEKPILRMNIVAGIYVVNKKLLNLIPKKGKFGMDEVILEMLKLNMPVGAYEIKNYWIDIGQLETLEEAQNLGETYFDAL